MFLKFIQSIFVTGIEAVVQDSSESINGCGEVRFSGHRSNLGKL